MGLLDFSVETYLTRASLILAGGVEKCEIWPRSLNVSKRINSGLVIRAFGQCLVPRSAR